MKQFEPYDKTQDENPEAREALRKMLQRMKDERRAGYVYVNNRLEEIRRTRLRPWSRMKLPIDDLLPRIVAEPSPNIVIEAAPGAGKTTRVPPALLKRAGAGAGASPRRRAWLRSASLRRWVRPWARPSGIRCDSRTVGGPRTRLRFH